MDMNTATQRPLTATPASSDLLAMIKPLANRLEAEYGCVDWFPYATQDAARKDWFDSDSGLAAAGTA